MTHREILMVLAGLMTGMFLVALNQTIVSTALPTIAGDLGGLDLIAWIVTAYLLAATTATPLFGRLSDLYGRQRMFQSAIVIFLVGSVLSGAALNMPMLIATRAIQGVGGGGVMALTMTIIGDLLSPRERGRYQGYLGAVFGVASITGPLLGGFIVDHLDWRWVFLVNVPIGIAALVVTSRVLDLPHHRVERRLDLLGASLLVTGVTALLLVTAWGGSEHPWGSPLIVVLGLGGGILSLLFVLRQRSAPQPIIPLRLFASRTFSLVTAAGFLVSAAMFGAIVFLPVFLQLVTGASATEAGLLLTPMMGGLVVTSMVSGRLISRTGRYRAHPITGTALMAIALSLMSTMDVTTSRVEAGLFTAVMGIGLGLVTQNLILIAQNDVAASDLGAATATVGFSRTLGGSIGTAVFGAVMAAGLFRRLGDVRIDGVALDPTLVQGSPATILALEPAVREAIVDAFAGALSMAFLAGVPLALLACLLLVLLPDRELRETRHVGSTTTSAPS
ncbi:MAG: MDR family MFS transporter [Nitriliruptoraceae bacterium]